MSLFKTRDWWSAPVESEGGEEECLNGHLLVGNITNEEPPTNLVVVGGFSGRLKVYAPQTSLNEENEEINGYRPDHLVFEAALNIPILQLAFGKFVSANSGLHLCVLHHDHFVVYTLSTVRGQTEHGSQAKLIKAYQHKFQRKAFSITTGNFGSVTGRDFIAVQSLDGCITFYEQESVGFVCFLPGFLLPGPLVYLPKSDTLVTQASDWTMQSYKYQTLSVLVQENLKNTNNLKVGGKRIQPEWTQVISQAALEIKVLVEPGNVSTILLLATHSFLCYKDSGILKFVKKLEYNPACFTAFHHDRSIIICVASHTHNLLVYKESELKWASQLPFVPVAIERTNFKGITGSLVLLGDEGQIQVCYLGTDPSLFVAPPNETREINYEHTDQEMSKLNKIIRSSTKDTGNLVSLSKADRELFVTATLVKGLEAWAGPSRVNDPDGIPSVTASITLTTNSPIRTVRVNIHTEKPIGVSQDTYVMTTVCDSCQVLVKFYLADQYVPSSLNVMVVTSYVSVSGTPFVTKTELQLPLKLVVKPSAPNKEADHKITLSTNKAAVNLPDLFSEFDLDNSVSTALGLQYYGGANVTILSSRTTNRYRMQSDSLSALWLIFESVKTRLEKYWKANSKENEENLILNVTSPIPLQELFSEIDAHFLRRRKHKEIETQLVQRATQFRAVQRRLLTKFKDKTPTPLTNFDNLLEGTYKQILQLTEAINNNSRGLEEDGCQLSCVLRLLIELLCLHSGMESKQKELLEATLCPTIYNNMDQGWEEVVDNSVTFVLRSILGKGNQEAGVFTQALSMPSDTNKLKKHISLLVDKIMKGAFTDQSTLKTKAEEIKKITETPILEDRELSESEDSFAGDQSFPFPEGTEVPLGSKLGEDRARSARIKSARLQSARPRPSFAVHEEGAAGLVEEEEDSPGGSEESKSIHTEIPEIPKDEIEEEEPIYSEIEEREPQNEIEKEQNNETEEGKENEQNETEEGKENEQNETEEGKEKEMEEEKEKENEIEKEDQEQSPLENLKKNTIQKDALIEAPEDIFGNPVEEDW